MLTRSVKMFIIRLKINDLCIKNILVILPILPILPIF